MTMSSSSYIRSKSFTGLGVNTGTYTILKYQYRVRKSILSFKMCYSGNMLNCLLDVSA